MDKDKAHLGESWDAPWSVSYSDGSNNGFIFRQLSPDAKATFLYTPMTPELSSSGLYSGGAPSAGTMTHEQRKELWQRVSHLAASTQDHLSTSRPKMSGAFDVAVGGNRLSFVLKPGTLHSEFEVFVSPFRAP